MIAPPPPDWSSPGHEWRVVPEGRDWTTDPAIIADRRCRFGSRWRGYCRRPAVAALDRARPTLGRHLWYGYCADHVYGRWIEDGVVVGWRLRPIERKAP